MRAADPTIMDPVGEHPDRCGAVQEQEGQVFIGVPGGGQGAQGEPAEVDLVTVAQTAMRERTSAGHRRQDRRPVRGGELGRAGEEVGVQVSVGGVGHRQPTPVSDRPQCPQVPRRVDREGAVRRSQCTVKRRSGVVGCIVVWVMPRNSRGEALDRGKRKS